MEFKAQKLSSSYIVEDIGKGGWLDTSFPKALKIPFFPLSLCFPAGDVLDAVSEGLDHWNFGNWDLFRI